MHDYRAPRWMFGRGAVGGNVQTIWPALFARRFEGPRDGRGLVPASNAFEQVILKGLRSK